MPTSIVVSLSLTLLYLVISINKDIYKNWYLSKVKLDFLLAFMLGSWVFAFCATYTGFVFSIILSFLVVFTILFCHFSLYYVSMHTKKEEQEGAINEMLYSDNSATFTPIDPYKGKTGTVESRVKENYYLGKIDVGTDKNPETAEILVYCEGNLTIGGNFVITGYDNEKILAEKA